MAGLWQRTGNVTVTNGSKTVTGFGTKWKTGTLPIQKGHTFYGPDNAAYEVDTVVSDTEIFLVDTYRGGTLANQPYRIDITRTSTISQFAADLASLVAKYRSWFDGMMTWLTGSGDVAILNPDTGANVTIPSWKKVTSEGEGQAARAKTEADKAAASAALAGDIVAASALPLPDVWAPLSDSLRMITGYGRGVKVGDDVVAQMVNLIRSTTATYIGKDGLLKTAAANEPRFEKDGLLVEGQSTNLIPTSSTLTTQTIPVQAGKHTISFYGPGSVSLSGAATGAIAGTGDNNRVALTFVAAAGNLTLTVTGACTYGQLEALPFASSYIPTNGAAVTRAKDILYLAPSGNVPSDINMAFAAQIKLMGYGFNSWPRVFEISDSENKGPFVDMQTGKWGGVNIVGIRTTLAARFSDRSHWVGGVKTGVALEPYTVRTYSESVFIAGSYVVGSRDFYGHIRNLRAWFFSPTDDQMRAIK